MFKNLLSNALKYSRPKPEARIEVGSREEEDGNIHVWVKDNGVGFDLTYVGKLFGVFQRLHTRRGVRGHRNRPGQRARIVDRHGGRAWAEGEVGEGRDVPPHPAGRRSGEGLRVSGVRMLLNVQNRRTHASERSEVAYGRRSACRKMNENS